MKNILGEEINVEPLRFEFINGKVPHLCIFRGKKYIAIMSPNGWNGYANIYHEAGDPILSQLDNFKGLSISDMKLIIQKWEENIETCLITN